LVDVYISPVEAAACLVAGVPPVTPYLLKAPYATDGVNHVSSVELQKNANVPSMFGNPALFMDILSPP
jgi:hypothetical protein